MSLDMGWERLVGFRNLENVTWQPDMAMATYGNSAILHGSKCEPQNLSESTGLSPAECQQRGARIHPGHPD